MRVRYRSFTPRGGPRHVLRLVIAKTRVRIEVVPACEMRGALSPWHDNKRHGVMLTIAFPEKAFRGPNGEVIGFTTHLSGQSGLGHWTQFIYPGCHVSWEHGKPWPSKHSTWINWIKKKLLRQGFDVIQKRAWKDGHMVSEDVNYIRSRKQTGTYSFYVFDGEYMVRSFRKPNYRDSYSDVLASSALGGRLSMEWGLDIPEEDEIHWT